MTIITAVRTDAWDEAAFRGPLLHLWQSWRLRRKLRRLRHLEDRVLDDIGITREEVAWAACLPIGVNAALALQDRAKRRRKVEFERLYAFPPLRRAMPADGVDV